MKANDGHGEIDGPACRPLPQTFLEKLCSRSTTTITSSNKLSTKRGPRFNASISAAMDSPYMDADALAHA